MQALEKNGEAPLFTLGASPDDRSRNFAIKKNLVDSECHQRVAHRRSFIVRPVHRLAATGRRPGEPIAVMCPHTPDMPPPVDGDTALRTQAESITAQP